MAETTVYKVLTEADMRALQAGAYAGAAIDQADGYIHLSTAAQLTETVDRHFAGQHGLVVAAVDLTLLEDAIHWEPSRHGQAFPHLYGVLTLRAVVAHGPLTRDEEGRVRLPVAG